MYNDPNGPGEGRISEAATVESLSNAARRFLGYWRKGLTPAFPVDEIGKRAWYEAKDFWQQEYAAMAPYQRAAYERRNAR